MASGAIGFSVLVLGAGIAACIARPADSTTDSGPGNDSSNPSDTGVPTDGGTPADGGEDTVTIGTQIWMLRNLDVTTYRNGDPIPPGPEDPSQWANLTTGAWSYYDNDASNSATYGKLYNWYAVKDPRGLAPTGWHVASDTEWTTLTTYLGGESVAGGKLKETGTVELGTGHWHDPNTDANNSSGFTALPGGSRGNSGSFDFRGYSGLFWTATEKPGTGGSYAWQRYLSYKDDSAVHPMRMSHPVHHGNSVRCVKD